MRLTPVLRHSSENNIDRSSLARNFGPLFFRPVAQDTPAIFSPAGPKSVDWRILLTVKLITFQKLFFRNKHFKKGTITFDSS